MEDKMMMYLDTAGGIWILFVMFLFLELWIFRTKIGGWLIDGPHK